MATGLSDKNIDSVIKDIPKKGFLPKFWQEYRAKVTSGSGVAKCLKALNERGIGPSGDPSDAKLSEMKAIIDLYGELYKALGRAEGKCTKLQSHTKKFCEGFIKVVNKREAEAVKLMKNTAKIEAAQERQLKDEEKQLEKFKQQQEKTQELVLKELIELDKRAKNMAKACGDITKDVKLATADVNKLLKGLDTQTDGDGKLPGELAKRFENGLVALQKKYNLPLHASNLKSSLPKVLKELVTLFPQYFKVEDLKKERISAGASLKEAQDGLKTAQASFKTYSEAHKSLAAALKNVA